VVDGEVTRLQAGLSRLLVDEARQRKARGPRADDVLALVGETSEGMMVRPTCSVALLPISKLLFFFFDLWTMRG
jgi:hypothetical protein